MFWPNKLYSAFNIYNVSSSHIEIRDLICNIYKLTGFYVNYILNLNGLSLAPFSK